MNTDRFEGRVALITGGAAGMGRTHAEHPAAQGADIAVGDLANTTPVVTAVEALGRAAFAQVPDVTSEDSVTGFVAAVIRRFGRTDILVNTAGVYPFMPWDEMSFADWRRVMAIDLDGPFLMATAVVPHMRASGYGRIVTIPLSECWMLAAQNTHYIAAKMGVIGLTRGLATEAAESGITVNAAAPRIVAKTSIDTMMPACLRDIPANLHAIKRAATPSGATAGRADPRPVPCVTARTARANRAQAAAVCHRAAPCDALARPHRHDRRRHDDRRGTVHGGRR